MRYSSLYVFIQMLMIKVVHTVVTKSLVSLQPSWVQVLALLLSGTGTVGELFHLFEPQFP